MFIECMHEQEDGKLTCALIDGFAPLFSTDITTLKQFYNDAIAAGLFVTDGEKYWSERVLRNKEILSEKRAKKSLAGKKGMAARWHNKADFQSTDNTVITNNNTDITKHNKGKESKVKESKVNNKRNIKEILTNFSPDFAKAFLDFTEMRKTIKHPLTYHAAELIISKLDTLSQVEAERIAILEQSTASAWLGVFPLKSEPQRNHDISTPASYTDTDLPECLKG